jgi:hypothetical protein
MKSALFTVVLLMSGAAIAQDYPATEPDPAATNVATTSQATTIPDALAGQTDATTPIGMTVQTDAAAPPSGQIVLPGNTAPERDARGIAVISDAAIAPPGFNQAPGIPTAMGGPFVEAPLNALATQPATETYPACTASVTDNCVQTYERPHR